MIEHENVYLTEKWCPLVRMRNTISKQMPYNRSIFTTKFELKNWAFRHMFPTFHWWFRGRHGKCWGHNCSMWRWHNKQQKLGYCGVAGHPIMEVANE